MLDLRSGTEKIHMFSLMMQHQRIARKAEQSNENGARGGKGNPTERSAIMEQYIGNKFEQMGILWRIQKSLLEEHPPGYNKFKLTVFSDCSNKLERERDNTLLEKLCYAAFIRVLRWHKFETHQGAISGQIMLRKGMTK